MSWHAKPSGGYGYSSVEGAENISEINGFFNGRGYTLEAQAGVIGNIIAESALNPWRWQSDTYNTGGGYGLFQYTPASGYLSGGRGVLGYAPNLSATSITSGAQASDGYCQLIVFADDMLGKWVGACWRDYWSASAYPALYQRRTNILNNYGNGSYLTMYQFSQIDDIGDATFAFLACFEGPLVPNFTDRLNNANAVYSMLSGDTPDDPPGPGPISGKFPPWLLFKIKWNNGR